jgi:hypothetical protein
MILGYKAMYFSGLWKRISKWPQPNRVAYCVYRHLGATDETKAEVYKETSVSHFRWAILENSTEEDVRTLALAKEDADEDRREFADRILAKAQYKKDLGPFVFDPLVTERNTLNDKVNVIGKAILRLDQRAQDFQNDVVQMARIARWLLGLALGGVLLSLDF